MDKLALNTLSNMLRILILILICAPQFLWSQSFKNEADLIKHANANFKDGSFIQALPLFSQLVSLHPKNTDYNFKFGTCILYSGVDKETAIKHIEFSTKKSVNDVRAYYYLGLAKHLNYDFKEAKIAYSSFLDKADEKTREKFNAQRQIEMCSNGEGLLSSITDLVVLEKKQVSENDFFRYYDLNEIGGKVIAKPEALITKNDKKKGLKGVVHFDKSSEYIFYSSYGNNGDQLDLYRVKPLAAAKFSKPEKLVGEVNTSFDEDFAFMHSDGETLYFASEGHTSMGGFDVFRARYDVNSDQYIQVKNLDFAVNTPDDDLFYLVDSTKTMAYFASGRSSALNNLHIYKVRVDAVPVNLVIIQGDFISRIDEKQKSTKISIIDELSGRYVGEFYTNSSTGNYTIPFERAGTYKFEVEAENSLLIHEGIVEIPSFDVPVALRQELVLSKEGGTERLQIRNFFDEILNEDIASLTQDILRRKAGLEVNADEMTAVLETQIQEKEELLDTSRPLSDAGAIAGFSENPTIAEIVAEMKEQSAAYKSESENLKQRTKEAYAEAKINQALASEKLAEGKALIASADLSDSDGYIEKIKEGNLLLVESKSLRMASHSLLEVVKAVDAYSTQLDERAASINQNAEKVESSTDFDEVLGLLKDEKERERSISKEDSSGPEVVITQAAYFTVNELENLDARINLLREEKADLERKLRVRKNRLESTTELTEVERFNTAILADSNALRAVKKDLENESAKMEALAYSVENYALQRDYIKNITTESHDFQGEPLVFSASEIEAEIAASEVNVQETSLLIAEKQEYIAAATDELNNSVDLSTIQSKAGSLPNGLELTEVKVIQSDYKAQLADLYDLENVKAHNIREEAIKETYASELSSSQKAIDEVLANTELTPEERTFLETERKSTAVALSQVEFNETLPPAISTEEVEAVISQYAANEYEELAITQTELSSLEELSAENDFTQTAKQVLVNVLEETNGQIALSENAEEIITLSRKVNTIKQEITELNSRGYETTLLNTVYEKEVSSNPERELEITEDYRKVIEQKIMQLEEQNKTASIVVKSKNLNLKKNLVKQLTLTSGALSNLKAQAALVESGETAQSETETDVLENSSSEKLDTETTEGRVDESEENLTTAETEVVSAAQATARKAIAEKLAPSYESRISGISENSALSALQMNEEMLNANQEFISSIENAATEKETELNAIKRKSRKGTIQDEISVLEDVKNNLLAENETFETRIAELKAVGTEENTLVENRVSENSEEVTEELSELDSSKENTITENGETENSTTEEQEGEAAIDSKTTADSENIVANRDNDTAEEEQESAIASKTTADSENIVANEDNGTAEEEQESAIANRASADSENIAANEDNGTAEEEQESAIASRASADSENIAANEDNGTTEEEQESAIVSRASADSENIAANRDNDTAEEERTTSTELKGETTGLIAEEAELSSEKSNDSNENSLEKTTVLANTDSGLTKEQIKTEVKTLPAIVTNSFYENAVTAEVIDIDELTYSEPYEDLIENNLELNSKIKKQAQIAGLTQDIERLKAQETTSEKEEEKLTKRIVKFEKKRAKLEVKNLPYVLETAQSTYAEELERVDAEITSAEFQTSKSAPLMDQIQKMRASAEVYSEDAEFSREMAEKSSKRDLVKKEVLYKEATAKQLAASENLKKIDWLVSNSAALAELSPETLALMMADEGLAEEVSSKNNEAIENTIPLDYAGKVLLLENSIAEATDLEKSWNISSEELNRIKRSDAFIDYEGKAEQLSYNIQELDRIQGEIESVQLKAEELENQALEVENTIELTETESEKEVIRTELKRLRTSAQVEYANASKLEEDKKNLMTSSEELRLELLALQNSMNPTMLLALEDTFDFSGSEDVESVYFRSLDLSSVENQSLFSRIKDVYSETRPIPVEVKLPTGLVYKVQIGAFRKAISQTLYNDFAPVSGEELANGITRYTVGVFAGEILANDAKKEVRNLGFSDAFVVAYLNGERIPLQESRNYRASEALAAQNTTSTLEEIETSGVEEASKATEEITDTSSEEALPNASIKSEATSSTEAKEEIQTSGSEAASKATEEITDTSSEEALPNASIKSEATSSTEAKKQTFNPIESADDYYEKFPDAAEANQIEVLSGLFFTVQIGVYSKPVPSKEIFNIAPLNSESLANNNIRYSTGIYNNLQEAARRKEQVKNLGIEDAFVTAYYNGKRIGISAAKEKFIESGIEVTEVSNQLADERLKSSQDNTSDARPLGNKEYVIYIGTFKDEVPANIAKAILLLEESRGIVQEKVGDEVAFFTRSVKSEETAKIIQQEFESYEVFSTEIRELSD
ncbi:MAG: hypothetical protein QMC16_07945 [Flavobacteriales bacterium]